jgi:hypothetical protein
MLLKRKPSPRSPLLGPIFINAFAIFLAPIFGSRLLSASIKDFRAASLKLSAGVDFGPMFDLPENKEPYYYFLSPLFFGSKLTYRLRLHLGP